MPMTVPLTVVLVHGDERERQELRSAFEAFAGVQVVGERGDLRSGLTLANQAGPAILVLELRTPLEEVLGAASAYRLEHPDAALFLAGDALDSETLLRALRAGANEVLRRPLDRSALGEAVERVAALRARKQGRPSDRLLVATYSAKGGSGVSTVAANLAIGLRQQTGRDVALADFDYQSGDAAFLLGLQPARSLGDLLAAPRIDSASVQDALVRHESGIHVLSQPERLDRVDGLTAAHVGSTLEILSSLFDLVVVDAPHVLGDITLEILDRSSSVLLVVEPSVPAVRAARRALDVFRRLDYVVVPGRVRILVNRFSDISAVSVEQIEDTLGLPVFATVANDYAAVSKAINLGKSVARNGVESPAARDLAALARLVLPGESATPAADGTNGHSQSRGHRFLRLLGRSTAQ